MSQSKKVKLVATQIHSTEPGQRGTIWKRRDNSNPQKSGKSKHEKIAKAFAYTHIRKNNSAKPDKTEATNEKSASNKDKNETSSKHETSNRAEKKSAYEEDGVSSVLPDSAAEVMNKNVMGYKVKDLLKAPIEVPEPEEAGKKRKLIGERVFLITVGALLGILGVIVIVYIRPDLGISLGLTGAIAIAGGVFWEPKSGQKEQPAKSTNK